MLSPASGPARRSPKGFESGWIKRRGHEKVAHAGPSGFVDRNRRRPGRRRVTLPFSNARLRRRPSLERTGGKTSALCVVHRCLLLCSDDSGSLGDRRHGDESFRASEKIFLSFIGVLSFSCFANSSCDRVGKIVIQNPNRKQTTL